MYVQRHEALGLLAVHFVQLRLRQVPAHRDQDARRAVNRNLYGLNKMAAGEA